MPKRRRAMSTLSVDRGGQTIGALAYPNVSFPPDERDRGEYLVQDIFVCWQTRISNQLAILTRNNWHSIGILLCASFSPTTAVDRDIRWLFFLLFKNWLICQSPCREIQRAQKLFCVYQIIELHKNDLLYICRREIHNVG